jgi:hypothetical protein
VSGRPKIVGLVWFNAKTRGDAMRFVLIASVSCALSSLQQTSQTEAITVTTSAGDWLNEEFKRAEETLDRLPAWAQPVVTRSVPADLESVNPPPPESGAQARDGEGPAIS